VRVQKQPAAIVFDVPRDLDGAVALARPRAGLLGLARLILLSRAALGFS
jgi:hypothetical protein